MAHVFLHNGSLYHLQRWRRHRAQYGFYAMVPCITCRDRGDIERSMVFTQWFLVSPAEIEET